MEKKIFVLDTNVLIHNPRALFAFEDNRVVIPIVVIEEIDQFKKGLDEKSRNARQISRYLDELRQTGKLQDGVPTDQGGVIQITVNREVAEVASKLLFMDQNDNLIIGTALYFQQKYPDTQVILVSKDVNVRIKADTVGIKAENFESGTIKFDEFYTGWTHEELDDLLMQKLSSSAFIDNPFEGLYPNQFVQVTSRGNTGKPITLRYNAELNRLSKLTHYTGQEVFSIRDRNFEQAMALDLLLDDDIKLVSLSGKAGTGKTLLAMAAGLSKVMDEKKYKRLVISRPISPLGKDLGYLPGTKEEKLNPWMQPIYDNMDVLLSLHETEADKGSKDRRKTSMKDFMDYGFLELEPLTYIRGRSLPEQFMIIDESQNLTPHEMKTIITRAGKGTKIVLTGDPYQIDIPYLDAISNGLSVAVEKLKSEPMVGHMTLDKGERSELADLAAKYF